MARWLILVGSTVVNVVEAAETPLLGPGEAAFLALTGGESIGDNMTSVLGFAQAAKQAALDAFLAQNFDLIGFIKGGSAVVTAVGVGNFLAGIANNYRTLRASIAAAGTVGAVNAININAGWPSNP